MTPSQDGRSDVLRQMAGLEQSAPGSARRPRVRRPVSDDKGDNDAGVGDGVASEGPAEALAAAQRVHRQRAADGLRRRERKQTDHLKVAAVPILAIVGVLLLIPAVWAVLLLTGTPVWHHQRTGARSMAAVMLICGPIALAMFCGAAYYGTQLRRGRRNRR